MPVPQVAALLRGFVVLQVIRSDVGSPIIPCTHPVRSVTSAGSEDLVRDLVRVRGGDDYCRSFGFLLNPTVSVVIGRLVL